MISYIAPTGSPTPIHGGASKSPEGRAVVAEERGASGGRRAEEGRARSPFRRSGGSERTARRCKRRKYGGGAEVVARHERRGMRSRRSAEPSPRGFWTSTATEKEGSRTGEEQVRPDEARSVCWCQRE
mmetsp:Transcript_24625/g.52505  ORF Transcript_24625/g.52505 Transcript_24625/m.52505 type:complete len:128 (-) Transcript_24625:86-469(-)